MKIPYFILLCALAMFFMLYADDLSLIIFVSAAVLPVVMLVILLLSVRRVKLSLSAKNLNRRKGEDAEITLGIKNESPFPISAVKVVIVCGFLPSGNEEQHSITVPMPGRKSCSVSIKLRSDLCRRAVCSVRSVKLCDFIHLFTVRKRNIEGLSAAVDFLPSGTVPLDPGTASRLSIEESVSGEASFAVSPFARELDELREYRDGDKLNRIAWKLCGKTGDEIIVRDGSPGRKQIYLLVADINSAADNEVKADRIYELFYAAAQTMCSHEISFDSIKADGSILGNISESDRLSECVSCIYGIAAGSQTVCENSLNRRYDKIVLVTASDDPYAADTLLKAYGAREAIIIN